MACGSSDAMHMCSRLMIVLPADMSLAETRRRISAASGKRVKGTHIMSHVSAPATSEVVTMLGPLHGDNATLGQFGVHQMSVIRVEPALALGDRGFAKWLKHFGKKAPSDATAKSKASVRKNSKRRRPAKKDDGAYTTSIWPPGTTWSTGTVTLQ